MPEIITPQKEMSAPTHGAPNLESNGLVSTTLHEGDYTMNPNLQTALELARRGWYVFPCRERRDATSEKAREIKSPYTPHGKNDATTDLEVIRAWWKRWPGALIGIYCEKSGFFAVDVDDKNGKNGFRSWESLVEIYGGGQPVHVGPVQDTPNGGCHLLFKLPEGLDIPNNADKLGDGLDLRSNGYICTGAGYSWLHEHGPEAPLPDAPAWLLDIIRNLSNHQPPFKQPENHVQLTERWLQQAIFRANIGNRNDTGFWLACQLRDAGLPSTVAEDVPYPESVPQSGGQTYSRREWIASVRSAYSQAPRTPIYSRGMVSYENPSGLSGLQSDDSHPEGAEGDEQPVPLEGYVPDLPPSSRLPDHLIMQAESVGKWLDLYITFGCKAAPMAPALFHQVIGQVMLSTAIARRVYLRLGNDYLYPNIYALIVANSTLFTKSTAFQIGKHTLEKAGLLRFTLPVGITPQSLVGELTNRTPETFSEWEKGDQDDWREERPFAAQRAWLMDESASLLDSFNQKTTADLLTHVLKLYDCPEKLTAASTVGRGRQTIRHAYLTICGPTTPAAMRVHLGNRDHWGNGLFARFLFVTPSTPPVRKFYPEPCDIPDGISTPLQALALERLEIPKEIALGNSRPPQAISAVLADGVWELWDEYHKGLWELMSKHQVLEKLFPNYGRLHTTAMKFAMQLAAIDWSMAGGTGPICITQAHFAKAQQLAEDYRASLHRMIEDASRPTEDEDFEKKIMRYLESASKGLTSREISRATHMSSAAQRQELNLILERMMEDGLIIRTSRKKQRGPDVDVWKKNPSRLATL
jgi:hypothetical protein